MEYINIIAAELDLIQIRNNRPTYTIAFWEDEEAITPLDLSPYIGTLKMEIKVNPTDVRVLDSLIEGTGLTIGGAFFNDLSITPDMKDKDEGVYYYDVVDTVIGVTILRGKFILEHNVTN